MTTLQVSIVRHTRNYEAMVRFYSRDLGMRVTQEWDRPGNRGTLLAFGGNAGSTVVEVLELGGEATPGAKPHNLVLSIEVQDVQALHDKLVERGAAMARGLEDTPWGHRSFGVDDPDGLRIWYYQDLNRK